MGKEQNGTPEVPHHKPNLTEKLLLGITRSPVRNSDGKLVRPTLEEVVREINTGVLRNLMAKGFYGQAELMVKARTGQAKPTLSKYFSTLTNSSSSYNKGAQETFERIRKANSDIRSIDDLREVFSYYGISTKSTYNPSKRNESSISFSTNITLESLRIPEPVRLHDSNEEPIDVLTFMENVIGVNKQHGQSEYLGDTTPQPPRAPNFDNPLPDWGTVIVRDVKK